MKAVADRNNLPLAKLTKPTSSLRTLVHEKPESWWLREGEKNALSLFREAAKRVPAYKKFLQRHHILPKSIKTIEDFKRVPETTKENYIKKYSLQERSWDGTLDGTAIIAASSGTTGTPTLWPRRGEQELEAAKLHEQLFLDLYEIDRYKTLAIIGFPMGVYVSGVATTLPSFITALQHPKLTLLTAGNNKESILKTLPELQKSFEQILLIGHPFFIKDVLETGKKEGFKWNKTKLRTFFCSEGFSESWRSYISSLVPGSIPERDFFNTYGSSEMLLMGYESPETILIREASEKHSQIQKKLFRGNSTPNLFQYNPILRYMEENKKGELLFTARSGVPLIRFNMHDLGELLTREKVRAALGNTYDGRLKKLSWKTWNLPFVTLYGRSDYTLVFYAANIYPEAIHRALNDKMILREITGKFALKNEYTSKMDQHLVVHVELQKGHLPKKAFTKLVSERIFNSLMRYNMEYADAFTRNGKDLTPKVQFHSEGSERYFKKGLKPKYIIK